MMVTPLRQYLHPLLPEEKNSETMATMSRVLQLSIILGFFRAVFLGVGMQFRGRIFTKNTQVLQLFVAATQPINSSAFILDGVNFGASDFAYTDDSMILGQL